MVDKTRWDKLPQSLLESLPEIPDGTFPLALTAFEKYLIWDETSSQPMTSFIELHFLDPLQVDVMEQALSAATQAHPMLACTLEERAEGLFWVHHPQANQAILRDEQAPPLLNGAPRPIDLRKEFGVRIWYSQSDQHSRLMFQLHHAVTDGVGMRRFIIDALTLYSQASAPDKVDPDLRAPWAKLDLGLLKQRGDLSDAFGGPATQPLTTWQRLKNAQYFHFLLPKPLRGKKSTNSHESNDDARERLEPLQHLVMDRQKSSEILEKARVAEIGMSDLALALLFETCCVWNQQHGDRNPKSRLRLLLPYDLRSRIDLRMSAANRLSFSFIGRTQADCNNRDELIQSIAEEVQSFSKTHLPLDFLAALESASKYPRLMRWAIGRSRNMATSVLTYVGDTSRGMQRYFPEENGYRVIGDARLDTILGAPPVRDNTHFSVGLCINWGQLCISAAWNRDGLTRKQCKELLDLYQSRWQSWLDSPP